MTSERTIQRLVKHATNLAKSIMLVSAMIGVRDLAKIPVPTDKLKREAIEGYIDRAELCLCGMFKDIIASPIRRLPPDVLSWIAERYDSWQASGGGIFTLSTAQEFENKMGKLKARELLEIPPYAELLIQPGSIIAFRHPEYMLVRDLELLHDLYSDTERLLKAVDWSLPSRPEWAGAAGENRLALGRTVLLTCFNLLESFVSGLARAHVMLNPGTEEPLKSKLLSTDPPLSKRVMSVPKQIIGKEPQLDINKPPLSIIFKKLKPYRDSFVHCEPGGERSTRRDYVKETLFHDVTEELVEEAVSATYDVIRLVWKEVYAVDGPRWLSSRDGSGRYRRGNLTIALPPDPNDAGASD